MGLFGPKPWVNPFRKNSIFQLFQLLVFIAQKGIFRSRISYKTFSWSLLPKKKKPKKMAIYGPKPWVNPFRKMSIFRLFEVLVSIAQKGIFLVLEYRKTHFPGLYCLKKKLEKWPFFDENHGLTPLEKCQFFDFLNFLSLQPRNVFFSFQNIVKHIFPVFIA